jgi:hypothetical protein
VTLDVLPRDGPRSVESAALRLQEPRDGGRTRVGEAAVTIALLPPGEYILRAIVTIAGREAGRVGRPFRIAPR